MRVLILSQYFWPESFRINEIAETLLERGVELEVLTGKPNYPCGEIFEGYRAWGCQEEIHHNVRIHRVPLWPRRSGIGHLAFNYISFVFSGLLFGAWALRKKKFDVIFVSAPSPIFQAIPAIFIGWLKGIPVIVWVQDLWPESLSATGYVKNKFILNLVEYVVRLIYQRSDLLLVTSKAFEESVRKLASNTPVIYYPNSVDDAFAEQATMVPPKVTGLGGGFSIMFAGNIGSAQAVGVIVEAATLLKKYEDIHFVVLGDGSSREWMLKEAQYRELKNLHLPGRFPVETMPGFMQQASALLVTLADQAIFAATVPNKIQAYMAAGRPIIACLNGEGARLVVEAGAGLATPAEDAGALANTILNLYERSPEMLEVMGSNGRKYYKDHFDHNHLVSQLLEHLESVSKTRAF